MSIRQFEDIIAWQKSHVLAVEIYSTFKSCRDFSFRDQIQRAAVSIINNIAEGYERSGDKELGRFFFIAKGSCGELRSMLYLALDLGYINKIEFESMYGKSTEISKMLSGFIKKLK
jgi:four helix bundle protein